MRDPLVPFLARHCLAGIIAGWTTLALLLSLDVARLGSLVFGAEPWALPLAMLIVVFAITFGSAAMGAAIMGLGRPSRPAGGRRILSVPSLPARMLAARVRVRP